MGRGHELSWELISVGWLQLAKPLVEATNIVRLVYSGPQEAGRTQPYWMHGLKQSV